MKTRIIGAALAAVAWGMLAGCAGKTRQLQMRDGSGAKKDVVFPKGRLLGGVSQEQVGALAQMMADSNTASSQRLDTVEASAGKAAETAVRVEAGTQRIETATRDLQASGKRLEEATQQIAEGGRRIEETTRQNGELTRGVADAAGRLEVTTRRIDETAQKSLATGERTYDTTRMVLEAFEKVSKKQGTGEITIFFPVASSRIERDSLQYARVVDFADFLARESRGRTIMLVSVGSASAFGPADVNERLAKERAEAPVEIFDQYLVNLPHQYVKMYGTGDAYSPRDVTMKEHQRYQTCRVIAFYEKGQEPALPEEPAPAPGQVSRR